MSRFDRLFKLAESATPATLERFEKAIYPCAARSKQGGMLLPSQLEAILKALSESTKTSFRTIYKSYRQVERANPELDKELQRVGAYLINEGRICLEKDTRDGPVLNPLCNFTAHITEERERSDGVERIRTLGIAGALSNGKKLPLIDVTAASFAQMNWPVTDWGTQAIVNAGQGTKDHLRAAIQSFSNEVTCRTIYAHLGWTSIGGRMAYLHAGGFIGTGDADDLSSVQVEAPQGLEKFVLPIPPGGNARNQAIRASFGTLDLAPDPVTVPLLGMVYRAVLGSVDFGGHLVGQTGAGKSELAAIMQQHFGSVLNARNLPGSWSSTANALEGLAFAGKDVLITIDDFAPEGSSHDIQRYHATAARLLRAQGNNAARGRMRADGTLRPDKPPRGMILSTGEDIPKGHSIKARTMILELEPGTLQWQQITNVQRLAADGVYASAMSAFIAWLAANYYTRTKAFDEKHFEYRDQLHGTGHKRTVDAGAQLLATYAVLLDFATEVGALSESERASFWQRIEAAIRAVLEPQAALQAQSDPVIRFSELLRGLFISGRAHVADGETSGCAGEEWGWEVKETLDFGGSRETHQAKGRRIGWRIKNDLYLEPEATYAALQLFAGEQRNDLPVSARVLWKRLRERRVIVSAEDGHSTVKRTFPGGERVRVLHISVSTLSQSGANGADGESAVSDSDEVAAEIGQREAEAGQSGQRDLRGPIDVPKTSGAAITSGAQKSVSETAQATSAPVAPEKEGGETPEVIKVVYQRFRSGELKGKRVNMPDGTSDDAEKALEPYFRKTRITDAERHDLIQIALEIVGESAEPTV